MMIYSTTFVGITLRLTVLLLLGNKDSVQMK